MNADALSPGKYICDVSAKAGHAGGDEEPAATMLIRCEVMHS
jgi:hypothetical protein